MGPFTQLKLKYADWKSMHTFLAAGAKMYYVETDLAYTLFLVDNTNGLISYAELIRDPVNDANATDFETNLKSSAFPVANVDSAIARQIGGF